MKKLSFSNLISIITIIIVGAFLLHSFLDGVLKLFGWKSHFVIMGFAIVSIMLLILQYTSKNFEVKLARWVTAAIVIRFIIMLWNVFGRDIFCLPGVGTDTEGFHESGVMISRNIQLLFDTDVIVYGSYYSRYLGCIYYIIGPSYLIGSFLNFLYGILSIFLLDRTIRLFGTITSKQRLHYILLYSFFPNLMIICSSLRRESLIIMLLMASLFFAVKWIRIKSNISIFASFAFVLLSCILHAGVIGVIMGLIPLFVLFDPRTQKWNIRPYSIVLLLLIIGMSLFVFIYYSDVFLAKITIEDTDDIYDQMTRSRGGAAYLSSLNITSLGDVIKYAPLKFIYFLMSPMPWDWRGAEDIFFFFIDSLVYVVLFKYLIRGILSFRSNPVLFCFTLSFLGAGLLFGVGASNAANAGRHRLKLLCILIILWKLASRKEKIRLCSVAKTLKNAGSFSRYAL